MRAEALARHTDQLRRLARSLLYDAGQADDVVQEAWLTALAKQRVDDTAAGGWMRGVVRNITRQRRRADTRRAHHEHAAGGGEPIQSSLDTASRIEVTRRVVEAVDALEEPYRTAIVKRFFEDRRPRQIAKELALPVNTVRTHIRRGLERLRSRLDADGGERRESFLVALGPLAGPTPWLAAPSATHPLGMCGAITMTGKTILGVAALGLIAFFLLRGAQSPPPTESAAEVASAPATDPPERPDALIPAVAPVETRRVAAQAGRSLRIAGETLSNWQPVAGVPVRLTLHDVTDRTAPPRAETLVDSDEQGRFSWSTEAPQASLLVVARTSGDRWTSWPASSVIPVDVAEAALSLNVYPLDARATGRVIDPDGAPIAGAMVSTRGASMLTGDDGGFDVAAPSGSSTETLRVTADGYGRRSISFRPGSPGATAPDIEVVLRPEFRVRGTVRDSRRQPISGASVSLVIGGTSVETDTEGRYELGGFDPAVRDHFLVAEADGFGSTQHQITVLPPGERWEADAETLLIVDRLEIERSPEPLERHFVLRRGASINGVARGHDGAPLPGVEVFLGHGWDTRVTDGEGRFRYDGLEAGSHALAFRHRDHAYQARAVEVAADRETSITVDLERGHVLAGRVITRGGQPIARAVVNVSVDGEIIPARTLCGSDGAFEITGLPSAGVSLRAWAPHHQRLTRPVDRVDRRDVELVLEPTGLIRGVVLDAAGRPLPAFRVRLSHARVEEGEESARPTSEWTGNGVLFQHPDGEWDTGSMSLVPGRLIDVEIDAPGFAKVRVERHVIEAGHAATPLVVRVGGLSVVRGTVVIEGHGPAVGARVRLFEARLELLPSKDAAQLDDGVTDEQGRFRLSAPSGRARLSVTLADGEVLLDGPFDVPAVGEVVRLIAVGRGAIAGRVVDRDGSTLAAATLTATRRPDGERAKRLEATSAIDGSFRFDDLRAGTWMVSRLIDGEHGPIVNYARWVDVAPGQTTTIELGARGDCGLDVSIDAPDAVRAAARLTATLVTPDGERVETHAGVVVDGRAELRGLAIGRYEVLVGSKEPDSRSIWRGQTTVEVHHGAITRVDVSLEED